MPKALLSVYDKTGIKEFAQELINLGWSIISSGGTARVLKAAGLTVTDVAEISGLGPILDHRVVTLVPQIHGGLLALEKHLAELESLGYPWIDLVCVDLYPLKEEVSKPEATRESVIDKTDIGGPTMLRAGAKGRRIVVADPADRQPVIDWLKAGKPEEDDFITALAAKAEGIIADYCLESSRYHSQGKIDGLIGTRVRACKYGENAWQKPASLYTQGTGDLLGLDQFELIEGDEPSFNNLCDLDRLLGTITHIAAGFDLNFGNVPLIALGVKHGNACGAAVGNDPIEVLKNMIKGDPLALFGGLVKTNFSIGQAEAECLRQWGMPSNSKKRLLDGVIAPGFSSEARAELNRKGGKCRLLANGELAHLTRQSLDSRPLLRPVRGGFLKQPNYTFILDLKHPECQWYGHLSQANQECLVLAWAIGSTSNSNTITLVRDGYLIGNGVGQQDRLLASKLAVERASRSEHHIEGAVAYSDSFFPFPDGPLCLAEAGVKAIFASSGSVNDQKVIDLCRWKVVTLIMMPDALCRGFYNH